VPAANAFLLDADDVFHRRDQRGLDLFQGADIDDQALVGLGRLDRVLVQQLGVAAQEFRLYAF